MMAKRNPSLLFIAFLIICTLPLSYSFKPVYPVLSARPERSASLLTLAVFSQVDSIIAFAKEFLGLPYIYASANPKTGFDCSGFVWYVYAHYGIKVPRSSIDYETLGKEVCIDSCRKGDIIVFTGTNAAIRHAGHVGIIISNPGEDPRFIHSSSSKKHNGVVLSSFSDSPYYGKRFIKVVRVLR
jgi:cell wall-associated NlpC family hydrolase